MVLEVFVFSVEQQAQLIGSFYAAARDSNPVAAGCRNGHRVLSFFHLVIIVRARR